MSEQLKIIRKLALAYTIGEFLKCLEWVFGLFGFFLLIGWIMSRGV